MLTFGEEIRMAREARKVSQGEMARQLGVSAAYLSDLERGRRNPPSDRLVAEMAGVLTIPSDWLYYLADRFPPDLRGVLSYGEAMAAFDAMRRDIKREVSER
jgi:transcriptional regulator with XRE-family HTH domain